jgi:DNA-binding NarL/FixJ family response regulator
MEVLTKLVPNVSRPQVPVIVLTQITDRAVWEVAKENGAYACFHKHFTTGDDLNKAIQRAVACEGRTPKEEWHPKT